MDNLKNLKAPIHRISSTIPIIRPTFSKPSSTLTSPRRREEEFREVFRRFDTDNDGKISAYELRAYFGSVGEHMSHEEAEAAIGHLDGDGDGLIDFQDFLELMHKEDSDGEKEADLRAAFRMFEFGEGSGKITPRSLQKVLNMLGDTTSYDECVSMIKVYDIDGNGELDFHEFQQMMAA